MVIVDNDRPQDAQTLPSRAPATGLGDMSLPDDPEARAEALSLVVERQSALLQREDEVHRVLVRVVLAGGSLVELCDAVAGILGGAAVVTTTDGRVLAMAGRGDEVERVRGLDCFDRTGR